jgi:hypothetical protein
MTPIQFEGMKARAGGIRLNPHPERTPENYEWRLGWNTMEDQIQQALANARSMLMGMADARRSQVEARLR